MRILGAILARICVSLTPEPRLPVTLPNHRSVVYSPKLGVANLSHELLDEILSYLPSDDKQSFRNYSLVAKSWISPSRRRLFEKVRLDMATLQLWRNRIPLADNGLLQHVHSSTYYVDVIGGYRPECYVSVFRDYFPFLHQLWYLSLGYMHLPSAISQEIEIFSAFRHTLSRLSLVNCIVTINALVTLINYFPNLNYLEFNNLFCEADSKPASPLLRPLLGQLRISHFYGGNYGLLDQLSELGLVFDEIVFYDYIFISMLSLERIVNTVGTNAKRLRLLSHFANCKYTSLQVEPAARLTISMPRPLQTKETDLQHFLVAKSSPGIRDPCEVARERNGKPPFFRHLDQHSKGNVRATIPGFSN